MVHKKHFFFTFVLFLVFTLNSYSQIQELKDWLAKPTNSREPLENLTFSKNTLSNSEANTAKDLILKDKQKNILNEFGNQWDNRSLSYKGYTMPFFYQIFGSKPTDGRSLFISLHGGGGAPASVNDEQYNNQKHLYDATMNTLEGVYLAARAPENTWDLWQKSYIDDFFNIIIQTAIIKEGVNPNKVYIMGYSAGGDGLYQLAPRMGDRWAAAYMGAGHPGDASPLGLRNTPFTIHVGALDNAYNRNGLAKEWGEKLDLLEKNDPGAYVHDVQIHAGLGHWMKLKDAVALPWMKKFTRNHIPEKVVWKQDNVHHSSFYWVGIPENLIITGGEIRAEYNSSLNEINIISNYSSNTKLFINDDMLDLEKSITIKYQGTIIHQGILHRSILSIYETLTTKGDANLTFPCIASVINNKKVIEENINFTLSVNENNIDGSKTGISIYPNPADNFINVFFESNLNHQTSFIVMDFIGKSLKTGDISKRNTKIDLQDLSSGIYFLKIKNRNTIFKILKQ